MLLMMTVEFMQSKRPFLRNSAVIFFLVKLFFVPYFFRKMRWINTNIYDITKQEVAFRETFRLYTQSGGSSQP